MWDSTPWMIGGGARHSAEVGRLMAYAATSGAEGIITPADLKVRSMSTATNRVRVAPGACVVLNRYGGGALQSYMGRNPVEHSVPVTATTSAGGRSDLVIARVLDPQYEGSTPSDPVTFQYMRTEIIQGVSSSTTSVRDLNLSYPAIALARLDIPASTTNITSGMVTDLRRVANPRSIRRTQTFDISAPEALNTTSNIWWPSEAVWNVDVPEWAAIHKIRADVTNIVNLDANIEGYLEVVISTTVQATARIDVPWAGATGRHNFVVAGETPVGAIHLGHTVPVRLRARRSAGTGWLNATTFSQVIFDIEFTEAAI